MKLVSVVIPTYNRANQVVTAIKSVLEQTYQNIEIIVVDDGSTDGSAQQIAKFGNKIKYLVKQNGGVSSARNYGIRHSQGELIAFLDSDDIFLPDKIKKQVTFLDNNPDFGLVLCDYYHIDSHDKRTGQSTRRDHFPRDGQLLKEVLFHPSLAPSSVLVRKDILNVVGLFDESLKTAEDFDLHLKLARITNIGLVAEPLFDYRRGEEGLSMLSSTYDDHIYVYSRFIKIYGKEIDQATQEKALFGAYCAAARGKFWMREWQNGCKYGLRMLKFATLRDFKVIVKIWVAGFYLFLRSFLRK